MNNADDLQIHHQHAGAHGAFFVSRSGERLAELTYTVAGAIASLNHTGVDDRLRGTGTGAKLIRAAVDWARASNLRLKPVCSYCRAVFDKTADYADVRAP